MLHYQCPICGQEQSFQDDKEYGFCQRCGTKLLLKLSIPSEESRQEQAPAGLAWHPAEAENAPEAAVKEAETVAELEAEEEQEEKEEKRSTLKAWLTGLLAAALILGAVACAVIFWIKPAAAYKLNMTRHENGQYLDAIAGFQALGDFRDSKHMVDVCRLDKALWELRVGRLADSALSLASIEDPNLDTSAYDTIAETRIQRALMGELDYDTALKDLSLLPKGRAGDVDSSFLYAFSQSLADKNYERAAWALDAFEPYISSRSKAEAMVLEEMVTLMDSGRFQDAADLNLHFASLLEDPETDVMERFEEFMADNEFFRGAALLEVFQDKLEDRLFFEEKLEEKLDVLLQEAKDDKVVELCYAFERFKDLTPLLQEKSSKLLAESAEKGDWVRLNTLVDSFAPYYEELPLEVESLYNGFLKDKAFDEAEGLWEHLDNPLFDKQAWEYDLAQALLEAEELDRAEVHFKALGDYRDSQDALTEIHYQQILKLWDEGKNEEAEALIQSLGSSQKAEEITKEAKLRSVTRTMEKELMEPAEFTDAYTTLYSIRNHKGASAKIVELLEKWADVIMENQNRRPYVEAMSGMGLVSAKNRSHICQYVIQKTEALAGRKKDGVAWTLKGKWLPGNVYRFLEQVSDDTGVTRAFIQYAMSIDKNDVELEVTDIWYLWDVREDIRELSSSNEYLVLFLSGVWKDAEGKAVLEVTKKNKVNTVLYNVPPTKQDGKITASVFGLTGPKGRLCDIKIIDYNTIELTNVSDGKTYKMTRP